MAKSAEQDLISMARKALEASSAAADDDDEDVEEPEVEVAGDEVDEEPVEVDEDEEPARKPAKKSSPEPTKSTFVRDYLRDKLSVDLSEDLTDEDIAPQFVETLSENKRLQDELAYLRQQVKESSHKTAKEPEQAERPTEKPRKWTSVEYDPDWERAADYDAETRQWVPKSKFGTWGVEAAGKLNEYARAQTERARKLTADPFAAVREAGLDEYLEEYRQKIIEEVKQQQEAALREWTGASVFDKERESIERFFEEHGADYFRVDKTGAVLRDVNGSPLLTKRGEAYRAAVTEARDELGITDIRKAHNYALKVSSAAVPSAKKADEPAKTPTERNKEQKRKFLERGRTSKTTRLASREGSVLSAKKRGEAQNQGLSFRDMVLQDPDNAEVLGAEFQG